MMRVNPVTNLPYKRGDVRKSDGKIFWQRRKTYKDKDGFYAETWYAPEKFEDVKKDNLKRLIQKAKENPETANKKCREWAKRNRPTKNANWARYFYAKLNRTPPWLTEEHHEQIREFYNLASKKEKETGVKHHVDHVIPLRGDFVSGLHVPWNLRVIPASENCKKNNKYYE
jgi:hypothetical protein